MKIVRRRPPFYRLICLIIGTPPESAIYTYGRSIYVPGATGITPDLYAHEAKHATQQGRTPWLWWARYLLSPRFRVEQEQEAYRAQLAAFPRAQRALKARSLASLLASPMYGSVVSIGDAYAALTQPPRSSRTSSA